MNAAAGSSQLEVEDLRVRFTTPTLDLTAVDGVSFRIDAGEVFGLVGESGCGKTVTCRALIRLFGGSPPSAIDGTVRFAGRDLGTLDERAWTALRGSEVSMIFQDPMASLNPTMRVGSQIAEGRTFLQDAWWISVFPGLAIVYVGITFTVLGEGLDDFLRPKG